MRQNMTDVTPLPVVMNDHDEAVLVSRNVEDDKLTNLIHTPEKAPHVGKIFPTSGFNDSDPVPQSRLGISMHFPELLQRPSGYQTHSIRFSQNAKVAVNRPFSQNAKIRLQPQFQLA